MCSRHLAYACQARDLGRTPVSAPSEISSVRSRLWNRTGMVYRNEILTAIPARNLRLPTWSLSQQMAAFLMLILAPLMAQMVGSSFHPIQS